MNGRGGTLETVNSGLGMSTLDGFQESDNPFASSESHATGFATMGGAAANGHHSSLLGAFQQRRGSNRDET